MIDPERLRQIDQICDAALDRDERERPSYVAAACGNDASLRQDVEALLAHAHAAEGFLLEPVKALSALVFPEHMGATPIGTTAVEATQQPPSEGASHSASVPAWPFVLLAIPILLRAAIFAIALLVESWSANANRIIPAWAQLLQATLFASLSFLLLLYGRRDRRAWSLGLFILDAGATLILPFVRGIHAPSMAVRFALQLPTDAFQASLLWFFASAFPRPSKHAGLTRVFFAGAAISFVLGLFLAGVSISAHLEMSPSSRPTTWPLSMFQRTPQAGRDWYFTSQFLLLLPLVAAMPFKLREAGPDDRRRFMWLALGILVGFLPLAIDTSLATLWPDFARLSENPPYLHAWGALIVIALTAVPLAAAYAALVQRTLDVRLVLRAALQYVLARSFIMIMTAAPFLALVILVVAHRDRSVADLLSGGQGLVLVALSVGGLAAAMSRRRLRLALDTRFFRQEVDAKATLLAVADAVRHARSLDEFRDTLVRALDGAFHPSSVVTVVAGADDELYAVDADVPSLPKRSALVQLLAASDVPLDVSASSPIVGRLTGLERKWLELARATLLLPLRGATDPSLGLIALGEKRSELAYTDEDRTLLAAVATASGFALDRILVSIRNKDQRTATIVADPPGRECIDCGKILEADAIACSCGGLLQRAPVPYLWADHLQFVQRIGEGGAGVVYKAIDLRLHQARAVKTLPGTDPTIMTRLRREARVMAAATHPNLAVLHGLEIWHGAPLLVMEFLEGGTLADRLKQGRLPLPEALTLGIHLASALVVLHGASILHRDIKPSNIGFTADGVPKLLDFGLAKLVAVATTGPSAARAVDNSTWSVSMSEDLGIRGTPAYLSPSILGGSPPSVGDDLWSLSVTLLEACTGSNPFRASTVAATITRVLTEGRRISSAVSSLPEPASQLFAGLLGESSGRSQSAQEYSQRLRRCL